jgi:hypothetical protein
LTNLPPYQVLKLHFIFSKPISSDFISEAGIGFMQVNPDGSVKKVFPP